jgi:hypothetical protein|tara:strand:+ start:242 stop:532 length:291 start_codon:yes stop_codon:yes gene_type:complete
MSNTTKGKDLIKMKTINITEEELKLLEDALQNQYDSNFESDYEMLQEEIVKTDCDWGFASSMCFKFEEVHEAFKLLTKLKERNVSEKRKDSKEAKH